MPITTRRRNHPPSTSRLRMAFALGAAMLPAALATASNTDANETVDIAEARPNVVVMLADNLGYGDLGCYGSGGIVRGMPTPNIDGLAAEGLMLTQFFVEPGCTPTRAGLMTGRHSVRAGLGSIIVAGTPSSLQDEEFTMAELFKKNGYATGMVGKWHLGQEEQSLPINQGFDTYKVGILETTDGTMYPESMRRTGMDEEAIVRTRPYIWESDGEGGLRKVRPYDLAYRDQVEGDIAGAAVEFIDDHASKKEPFFLYVGWSHVHYPAGAAEAFQGRSPAGPYGDMLMEHDHQVGAILDAVDAAGIRENTVVAYLSDNGPVQFQASNDDFSGSSPGPFRASAGTCSRARSAFPA
ncbi:MAG: sulfatase-like hydrolase/transferase [Planctomycetota bacterium]